MGGGYQARRGLPASTRERARVVFNLGARVARPGRGSPATLRRFAVFQIRRPTLTQSLAPALRGYHHVMDRVLCVPPQPSTKKTFAPPPPLAALMQGPGSGNPPRALSSTALPAKRTARCLRAHTHTHTHTHTRSARAQLARCKGAMHSVASSLAAR